MAEQERRVVAYLGPKASYTYQAALDAFKSQEVTLSPQITIADVFTAVQNGSAYRGVVPFENSSNGSVVFTLDLFADIDGTHADILVCGESYVAVKHCLLGHASSSPSTPAPQSDLNINTDTPFNNPLPVSTCDVGKIKKLYSHPQAWGQCKTFLSTYFKAVKRQDVSSTSHAAELVAQDPSGQTAALSSAAAAREFGLDILADSINDRIGNTTRFLVIRNPALDPIVPAPPPPPPPSLSAPVRDDGRWNTLVIFTVDHANPGALALCLASFAKFGLNLTSINTRPSGAQNWNYIFFVELEGRKEDGEENNGAVNQALRELETVSRGFKWLGSWERITSS